jgi:serine/threonine protein kinase
VTPNLEPLKETDPRGFGGWKIKGRLGEGGYSTIFLGEKNHQLAAIKMIRSGLLSDETVFNRFATEINNLERIDHPGIAKYLESDLSTDVPYIAVEYVAGETLENRVQTRGPLHREEWLDCLNKVADALDYCHKIDITHKDVSPGNIILGKDGPRLIDFGISYHAGDQRITQPDETVGTPAYMSPEHWDSQPRNDMDTFSLGATFIFAGTGHEAFHGNSKQEVRNAIWNDFPNFEGLDKSQIEIIAPLLYKDFKDRPTLSDLIAAIRDLRTEGTLKKYSIFLQNSQRKLRSVANSSNRKSPRYRKIALGSSLLVVLAGLSSVLYLNSNTSRPNEVKAPSSSNSINSKETKSSIEMNKPGPSQSVETPTGPRKVTTQQEKEAAECQRLTDEGKASEAVKSCEIAAKAGFALSMTNLGYNYFVNLKNEKLGIYWYKRASNAGSIIASYNLGTLYLEKKDTIEAEKWFKKCSDSDYAYCSFNYGILLEKSGRIAEAKKVYQRGVDLKDSGSAQNLGLIYINEQDWAKAKEVLLIGAELDNYNSAYSLAQVYVRNYSDLTNACIWFYKSLSLNKNYEAARRAVIEICKNRRYEIAPDATTLFVGLAPYQVNTTASDRKKGDWVIWIKNDSFDASKLTGVQYKPRGSSEDWKFTFYGTYTNAAGVYSYISERPGLEGACLDFRLVRESKETYISQIWELPKSICGSA